MPLLLSSVHQEISIVEDKKDPLEFHIVHQGTVCVCQFMNDIFYFHLSAVVGRSHLLF